MTGLHLWGNIPLVYDLHGLRMRSPVPLAGFPESGAVYDVDVCWTVGETVSGDAPPGRLVAAAAMASGDYRYVAAEDRGQWVLRVPGVCDFAVSADLTVVECRLDPRCDPGLVAVLVAGLVVAFLLGLAGHCVLHASAVEIEGAALAFAGASGAGKSTLAALLCGAGARLVTDDVLRLAVGETVVCVGGCPQVRLRPGANWTLEHFAVAPAQATTADGRLAVTPVPSAVRAVPLSTIVLPRLSREASSVDLQPVRGATAVARLAAACRVTGWTEPDVRRAHFRALALVATGAQVVEAVIPWGSARPALVVAALRALAVGDR